MIETVRHLWRHAFTPVMCWGFCKRCHQTTRSQVRGLSALQAKFQALEELSMLKQLVQKCLVQGVGSWTLYTTPPKQV